MSPDGQLKPEISLLEEVDAQCSFGLFIQKTGIYGGPNRY